MTKETGTLKELNVQPGDVVEMVGNERSCMYIGHKYTIKEDGKVRDNNSDHEYYGFVGDCNHGVTWRIISRATPKTLKDMTWEEAEPIYREFHEGEVLDVITAKGDKWIGKLHQYPLCLNFAYRLKPKHKPTFAHWDALDGRS